MNPSGRPRLTLPPKRGGQLGEPMLPPKRHHRLGESARPPKWTTAGSVSRGATSVGRPTQPDGTLDQDASGIFSSLIWKSAAGQGKQTGAAPPRRSSVVPTCPQAGPDLEIPKLKGFLIRRPDGFSGGPRLDARGVRPGATRETYRLSCQRSLSHLTLMGFRPLQRIGQRKRPAPGSPPGCATLSGFLNLSASCSST